MKNILFVTDRLSGGAGMSLYEMMNIYRQGHNLILLSSGKGFLSKKFNFIKKENFLTITFRSWIAKKFENFYLSLLYRLVVLPVHFFTIIKIIFIIKSKNIDIVVTNSIYLIEPIIAAKICKKFNIVFVRELLSKKYYQYNFTKKFITNLLFKLANNICCNSHLTKKNFLKFIKKKKDINKVLYFPNIVSEVKNKKNIYEILKIKKNKKIVFSASWITPNKKIENLIKLINILDKNYILVFFGDYGHDKKYNLKINKMIKNNQKVIFFKSIPNIQKYMSQVDYVVSMCTTDSFNRIAAEGMVEKKIVLVKKNTAPEEYIKNYYNGFICKNIAEYKYFIKKIENNKNLKNFICNNAKKTIHSKFTSIQLKNVLNKAIRSV